MTSFYENADQEGGDIDYTSEIQDALTAALAAQAAAELAQSSATTSATTATTQAGNASTSATNASNDASSASASAIAAGLAQAASEAAQAASEAARDEVQGAISTLETFPADAAGVLTNDGAGNLSWGAGGGSFDPTASQTITGEWTFEVLPAESFLVTDDPTLTSPTFTFGVANGTFIPDNMAITAFADTTTGIGYLANYDLITFEGQAAVNAKDAQIVSSYDGYSTALMWVSNGTVNSQISIAENASDAPINIMANKGAINITATGAVTNDNVTIEATNGKVNLVSDSGTNNGLSLKAGTNTTLFAVETHSTLGDYWSMKAGSSGVICPNLILNKDISSGANIKLGIGTTTVYGLEITRNSSNLITEKLYTPNGSITLTQDTDTSDASIALVTNGSGTATLNGSDIITASSNITSGSYTPTTVIISGNFTAGTAIGYYQRIGNIVSVSIYVGLTSTAIASTASFWMTIPVASEFDLSQRLCGVYSAFEPTTPRRGNGSVFAHVANDTLRCDMELDNGVGSGDVVEISIEAKYVVR